MDTKEPPFRTVPDTMDLADYLRGTEIESLHLPPHSVEAEQAVLGGLLVKNSAFERIADVVSEADFYRADHRIIWRAIVQLVENCKPADVVTVMEALRDSGQIQEAGGVMYLHQLASNVPSAANIKHYANIVQDRAQRRGLIQAAQQILDEAYARNGGDTAELVNRAQALVMGSTMRASEQGAKALGEILGRVMQNMDDRQKGIGQRRYSTGLTDLDRALHGGMRTKRVYFIGGRPAMGKSALGLQIGLHMASEGNPGFISSMEMGDEENGERALAGTARITLDKIITGTLDSSDWDRAGVALGKLNALPLAIDETPALTLNRLKGKARAQKVKNGGRLAFVLVDYLQLMKADGKRERNDLEVGDVAQGLKELAKELDVVVIALSGVNRGCESRTDKRPNMADLSQSGGIESAADFVAFVYRDEVYNPESPERGIAELVIRKHRQGKIVTIPFTFQGEYSRFENFAGQSWSPAAPKRESPKGLDRDGR